MDDSTTQLMPAIRHDLDLGNLDIPAFEAMVKSLSCAKPDEITLRQLDVSTGLCIK
ncbi:unnamed protein product [Dibothriocephalus latus]|uniref:Uncharacterized protein n=1 Tax=Dibothriocephalus latus TaxID=60516 RepID=A0A3P7NQC2_DIBLA|nr:unnamed protein product [Dibothriocephalus latus]